MNLFYRIRHYTVYRRIFISYIFLLCVTISLIAIILFQAFSYNAAMEINNISQSMLSQISYASDVIYDQVFLTGNQLMNDNTIVSIMHTKEKDRVLENMVVRKLSSIQSIYPFIKYVGIYNGNLDLYLSNKGLSTEQEQAIIEYINNNSSGKYFDFMPRKANLESNEQSVSYNVLTFILYSNYSRLISYKGALIININEEYIQNTLKRMNTFSEDITFVIDSKGVVLSHSSPELFLQDFSKQPHIQKILRSHDPKGYLLETVNGQRKLVTYVKSQKMGWIYISAKPYQSLLSNIIKLKNITFLAAVILFAIGVMLSFWLTGNIYNPVKMLMEKMNQSMSNHSSSLKKQNEFELLSDAFSRAVDSANSLKTSLETVYPLLKNTYIRMLLNGRTGEFSELTKILNEPDINLSGPYFTIVLIKLDHYQHFNECYSKNDQAVYWFAIANVAEELLHVVNPFNSIQLNENELAVLVQLNENSLPASIFIVLSELQKTIKNHFDLSISISIGDIVQNKAEINLCLNSARINANDRFFFGPGSIIDNKMIRGRPCTLHEYPHTLEKKIVEAIQLNNKAAVEKEFTHFIEDINRMDYDNARAYCNQLTLSWMKHFEHLIKPEDSTFFDVVHRLSAHETLYETAECIWDVLSRICVLADEKKDHRNMEIIKHIQEYIHDHYHNPELSLDTIADQVHLSPGYVGKLFKNMTSISLNDYINQVRLDKAKEMLSNTNYSTSVICEKIGIYNNTYFFTLFKKAYGVTPAQYRKQLHFEQ